MNSLTVIPNGPVTDQIELDIRATVRNDLSHAADFRARLLLDERVLMDEPLPRLAAGASRLLMVRTPTSGLAGRRTVTLSVDGPDGNRALAETIEVIPSKTRSPGRLAGMWNGIYHWSEAEGRHWNRDLAGLDEDGWRGQVRDMAALGMNVMVIQETFRNQAYAGKHDIPKTGYPGRAFYPSARYSGRMPVAAADAVEAILDEADKVGMKVFPGVGMYAWFDYSPGSLAWHKEIARELWDRYGHHPSFYGFYVSEEKCGDLGGTPETQGEIVDFFAAFREHCRTFAPDKPVMLAPNAWYLDRALDAWPKLLAHLDIVCPFAFHRMNPDDTDGETAAARFRDWCDASGTHLWLDMECFLFEGDEALVPRPLPELLDDLFRFPDFEKILGYQYAGLFCAPDARVKLGGDRAVHLYEDYRRWLMAAPT